MSLCVRSVHGAYSVRDTRKIRDNRGTEVLGNQVPSKFRGPRSSVVVFCTLFPIAWFSHLLFLDLFLPFHDC